MTVLSLLASAAEAPTKLDPLKLFLDADIVVQGVMLGLLLASVWVWMIIISFLLRMGRLRKRCDTYEVDFWNTKDFEAFQAERGKGDIPSARIAAAGFAEWRRSAGAKSSDREGARQRLSLAVDSAVALEGETLSKRLSFLATVGSSAPFIGLFGTVWGIMNSFFQIGQQQSTSLAVVAPGISEALFATAIGLFAAIPAVIAYNSFSNSVNNFESRLQQFADRFYASLSRQLEF